MKYHIVNNTISGAKWGIIVSGGAPSIHGRNRVENNTVTGGGYGLYVTGTSSFEVYDNNTFKNNSVAGIYLGANANVKIEHSNVIADNDCGIWINGGNATIRYSNKIHNNDYGIYVDTSYAPWIRDNNTIYNNTEAGVYLSSSVGTFNRQIWWNDMVDNGKGIEAEDPGAGDYFHAECNWWDDGNGPDDDSIGPPDYWDNDPGQDVSNYFHYRDEADNDPYWLQQHSNVATFCKE